MSKPEYKTVGGLNVDGFMLEDSSDTKMMNRIIDYRINNPSNEQDINISHKGKKIKVLYPYLFISEDDA